MMLLHENGSESAFLSTYAAVWLTLISGAILMKAAHAYWTIGVRVARKRNMPTYVGALLDKMPVWINYFAFVPTLVVFFVVLTIGFKIISSSGLDTLVRVQVGLAMCVLLGWIGGNFVNKADDRLQLVKPIYLVPMAMVVGITAFGLYAMMAWCPEHLAEQWWMPCFHSGG